MRKFSRALTTAVSLTGLILVTGCATKADVDTLRDDVMKAQQAAQSAAQSAAASAADAKAAAEKADRIYQQSLRK